MTLEAAQERRLLLTRQPWAPPCCRGPRTNKPDAVMSDLSAVEWWHLFVILQLWHPCHRCSRHVERKAGSRHKSHISGFSPVPPFSSVRTFTARFYGCDINHAAALWDCFVWWVTHPSSKLSQRTCLASFSLIRMMPFENLSVEFIYDVHRGNESRVRIERMETITQLHVLMCELCKLPPPHHPAHSNCYLHVPIHLKRQLSAGAITLWLFSRTPI